jgi:hypothetical protein
MVYRFFYHTKFDGVFEPSDSVTYTYNNEIPDLTPSVTQLLSILLIGKI